MAWKGTGDWARRWPCASRCDSGEPRKAPTRCAKASSPTGWMLRFAPRLGATMFGHVLQHHHARVVETLQAQGVQRRIQAGGFAEGVMRTISGRPAWANTGSHSASLWATGMRPAPPR